MCSQITCTNKKKKSLLLFILVWSSEGNSTKKHQFTRVRRIVYYLRQKKMTFLKVLLHRTIKHSKVLPYIRTYVILNFNVQVPFVSSLSQNMYPIT